jgi:membrane associated rhomboid family serine protease
MIPLKDVNPTSSFAWVTLVLIAVNIAVFFTEPVLTSGRSGPEQEIAQARYFVCHGAVPYEVTHGERVGDAFRRGTRFEHPLDNAFAELEAISCRRKNVWFSIVKSMFLHGSLLHIAGNMLFLWVFGNNVEDRLGRIKYVLFYLLSGVAAAYAQSYVFPSSATPLVGASGAVAGILGAYLLMFPLARVVTIVFFFVTEVPAFIMIGVWFVTNLLSSVGSVSNTGVAYMAHVGGFLAGMLLLLIFRPRKPRRPQPVPDSPYH